MSIRCKMPAPTSAVPKIGCVVALAAFTAMPGWAQESFEVSSPGDVVTVTLEVQDGTPTYSVTRLGADILEPSTLGVRFAEGPSFDGGLILTGTETGSFDETWEQVWGEKRNIRNHYNELRATFETEGETTRSMDVVFRIDDDGFGFRYEDGRPGWSDFCSFRNGERIFGLCPEIALGTVHLRMAKQQLDGS